jgi:hypothetical protein
MREMKCEVIEENEYPFGTEYVVRLVKPVKKKLGSFSYLPEILKENADKRWILRKRRSVGAVKVRLIKQECPRPDIDVDIGSGGARERFEICMPGFKRLKIELGKHEEQVLWLSFKA